MSFHVIKDQLDVVICCEQFHLSRKVKEQVAI